MNLSHVHYMMPSTSDFSTHKNVLVLAVLFVSLTRNFLSNPMETQEPRGLHKHIRRKSGMNLFLKTTLGPACNEFGNNEHFFPSEKKLINVNV